MKQQCSLCGSIDLATVFPLPLKNLGRSKYTAFTPTSSDFGIFYKLARCRSCGMQFAVLDGKDDIRGLYRDSSDTVYLAQEQDRGIAYKRIISELKAFMPAGSRLLDIGCSYGFFIKAAKASGFSVYGVEASSHAAEYCRKQGLGVFSGEIRQAEMPPESFDIICAIEVIEHLEDIRSFISEVYRILKPGGIFYVVTPNIRSFSGRVLGRHSWAYRRMHLQYFSRKTLHSFLKRNGFAIIKSSVYKKSFRLGYALSQLSRSNYSRLFYYLFRGLVRGLRLDNLRVTASFGDIAVMAKKQVY